MLLLRSCRLDLYPACSLFQAVSLWRCQEAAESLPHDVINMPDGNQKYEALPQNVPSLNCLLRPYVLGADCSSGVTARSQCPARRRSYQ